MYSKTYPRFARSGRPRMSRPGNGPLRSLLLLTMLCATFLSASTSVLAQQPTGLFGPQQKTNVTLTPDEARAVAKTLSDCEEVADKFIDLREERDLLKQALAAQTRATASYKAALDLETRRANNERVRADAEAAMKVQARDERDSARRSTKVWKLITIVGTVGGVALGAWAGSR